MRIYKEAPLLGMVALLFGVGCESAADQQRKANEAQEEANKKAAQAQVEADRTAESAQARANYEIADAQENFSKMREEFRHDIEMKLVEVDKEIASLRAHPSTENVKKKAKIDSNLPVIDERRARLQTALQRLEHANATTWDHTKGEVEKLWNELKQSVESAT